MHRSEEPKKGQEDFLEEVSSKLSATRKTDTASEEGRKDIVQGIRGGEKMVGTEQDAGEEDKAQPTLKRTRAQPTLLKQARWREAHGTVELPALPLSAGHLREPSLEGHSENIPEPHRKGKKIRVFLLVGLDCSVS